MQTTLGLIAQRLEDVFDFVGHVLEGGDVEDARVALERVDRAEEGGDRVRLAAPDLDVRDRASALVEQAEGLVEEGLEEAGVERRHLGDPPEAEIGDYFAQYNVPYLLTELDNKLFLLER